MDMKNTRHAIALYAEAWREKEPGCTEQPPICEMALLEMDAAKMAYRLALQQIDHAEDEFGRRAVLNPQDVLDVLRRLRRTLSARGSTISSSA